MYLPRKIWPFNVAVISVIRLRIIKHYPPLSLLNTRLTLAAIWIGNLLRFSVLLVIELNIFTDRIVDTWYGRMIVGASIFTVDAIIHTTNIILVVVISVNKFRFIRSLKEKSCDRDEENVIIRLKQNFKILYAFWTVYFASIVPDFISIIILLTLSITSSTRLEQVANDKNVCKVVYLYDAVAQAFMTLVNSIILLRTEAIWAIIEEAVDGIKEWFIKQMRYQPRYEYCDDVLDSDYFDLFNS